MLLKLVADHKLDTDKLIRLTIIFSAINLSKLFILDSFWKENSPYDLFNIYYL